MKRYNVFRVNVDRDFLKDTEQTLKKALAEFEFTGRISVETVDEIDGIYYTLAEMLDEIDPEDDF